jgi:SulP family sulfate permease
MAALAALLLLVAYNMSEAKHFAHIARVAPKSDVSVLLVCFGLTVVFDMTISVSAGMILAAFLFMRRMAEISGSKVVVGKHPGLREPLPKGVALYEIAGPLFFGAAQKAMSQMHAIDEHHRVVILEMGGVPAMDATGLVALESSLTRLYQDGMFVILSSVQPQPAKVLEKAGIGDNEHLAFAASLATAVARAKARLAANR